MTPRSRKPISVQILQDCIIQSSQMTYTMPARRSNSFVALDAIPLESMSIPEETEIPYNYALNSNDDSFCSQPGDFLEEEEQQNNDVSADEISESPYSVRRRRVSDEPVESGVNCNECRKTKL